MASSLMRPTRPVLPRANIVLVTLDCVRPDFLGCYGCPSVTTPTLDRMASRGIVCDQAITQAPNTWVSHAGILSGLYPPSHGLRSPYDRLDPSARTIASVLKEQGYSTAGFPGNDLVGTRAGFNKGFEFFFEDYQPISEWMHPAHPLSANCRNLWDKVLVASNDWLLRQKEPFFMWFHYLDTHHLPFCDLPEFYRFGRHQEWQFYEGKISYADERCIKSILDMLRKHGSYERTLIVVVSDHGEELSPGLPPYHNGGLSDQVLRVPMILFSEALPWRGTRIHTQVRTVDLLPTLLHLALDTSPVWDDPECTLAGVLLPMPSWNTCAHIDYTETFAYAENEPFGLSCIRTDTWKLVTRGEEHELYHLPSDPKETKNLSRIYPTTASCLRNEMTDLLKRLRTANRIAADNDREQTRKVLRSLGYVE